jgi:hypothetical protein
LARPSTAAVFVECCGLVIATAMRARRLSPNRLPAALDAAIRQNEDERTKTMTADKFRTLSSWVAAAFISVLMLTAAATSHPILI